MDNKQKFNVLRKKYDTFIYEGYNILENDKTITIKYNFNIPNLTVFHPQIIIKKKNISLEAINSKFVNKLVFSIGLVELISYWKCVCSPNVKIKCGKLNSEQVKWFKKLYFYGLGELFFTNNINTNMEEFMRISSDGITYDTEQQFNDNKFSGVIIPIGGGKDSVVTLELLGKNENVYALIVNPNKVSLNCAKTAGIRDANIIEVKRVIDKQIIDLNKQGYINGHTPFSALLAFLSYFVAYLTGKKYIALSNESSANESNIKGTKINHQYSKSFEFENDFNFYVSKYLKAPIKYFSFLRPLNEVQIAMLFSHLEKYHYIFKSCNVGSKKDEWKWCCNCPKCLFVYTMLSPFIDRDKLINIFGEDLFEKKELLKLFIDLSGYGTVKPFECVGTFDEVRFAISKTIKQTKNTKLPYLLEYYKKNFELSDLNYDLTKQYNKNNNLPRELDNLLKKEINKK